ncbi:MAG TPA: permease [Rubrobacter sp.]|jgi:uncharacterized membrane protein YraQ (UPF0718 family)|nr:permease [Rubrobacter sp.]
MTANLLEATRWFVVMTAELVALFLALSFLIVLLQAWVPEEKVRLMFEKRRPVGAYVGGAALGAITPFCSCSGIPVLAGLLRSGAPFGPTMAFLFASPLLDPVVLGLLAFVIGLKGAALYAIVTFVASIGMGVLLARLGLESDVKEAAYRSKGEDGCCSVDLLLPVWRRAWSEAWGFFVPILPYLLVGTAIGAVVYGFIPTQWAASVAGADQPLAIPMAAALGVPIYVNAETFFPITSALLEKGMGLGAVVALVVTGMGVSLPEVSMLAGLFRVRLVAVLIVSVFVVAIGSGMIFAHVGV